MLTKETQSCFNQTKKKKFLALLLSVAMVFALAACGAKEEDTAPDESGEAVQFSGSYLMGTGSAIAKGNAFKTGVNATKLAIAAFLIPYMFAFNPKMILIGGTLLEALPMIVTAIIGLVGIGAGFIGYLNGPVKPLLRLVSTAGGLCLVIPGTVTDIVGIALIAVVYVLNRVMGKKTEPAEK